MPLDFESDFLVLSAFFLVSGSESEDSDSSALALASAFFPLSAFFGSSLATSFLDLSAFLGSSLATSFLALSALSAFLGSSLATLSADLDLPLDLVIFSSGSESEDSSSDSLVSGLAF